MKSMLGRSRTALALMRYCVQRRMWWAAPAIAMLLIAGVIGIIGVDSGAPIPD